MRLAVGHQRDEADGIGGVGREVRVPDETGGPVAEHVGGLYCADVVSGDAEGDGDRIREAVARPVEVELCAAAAEVDEVRRAAAVDVGKPDAARVVELPMVE